MARTELKWFWTGSSGRRLWGRYGVYPTGSAEGGEFLNQPGDHVVPNGALGDSKFGISWGNYCDCIKIVENCLQRQHIKGSYLHRMNIAPSPNCNCPEKTLQTAHHLMLECSLLSKDRPPVLKTLPPPLILQYHINTVSITSFLRRIFQAIQDDSEET